MKRIVVVIVVATTIPLSAACERPTLEDTLVIGVGRDANVLLPVAETSQLDGELNALLYLSLNSARWEEGDLEYRADELALSEGWSFGPDSTSLTYRLRPEAVWSDGEPIAARDVVFTYELVRRPEIGSPYAELWESLDSVVADGPHQVTFHFERRYPGMLFDTGLGIVPEHVFAGVETDADLQAHPAVRRPDSAMVVSGPYRLAEWRRGERLALEPNPRAFTAEPRTPNVVFRIIPETTTRVVELENGTLHAIDPVPAAEARRLGRDARFRIARVEDRYYDYIAWNPRAFSAFSDHRVRRALSLAVDRESIIQALDLGGFARAAAGPYPDIFRALVDTGLTPDPYRPDSARALLRAAGWTDDDGDGVRERAGRAFRFTLLTQAGNARRESAAELVQESWAEVGVQARLRSLEFNTLLPTLFQGRDFQAVLLGWQIGLQPGYLVGQFWPPDHVLNITGYQSVALDSLIPLARAAGTSAAAARYWKAAARTIAEDRPYAFLWFFDDAVALSDRVKNARIDTYGVYQNLWEWRVMSDEF